MTGVFVNDFKQLEHVGRTRTEEEVVEEEEKEILRTCCGEDMVEIIPMKAHVCQWFFKLALTLRS